VLIFGRKIPTAATAVFLYAAGQVLIGCLNCFLFVAFVFIASKNSNHRYKHANEWNNIYDT